MLCRIGVRLLDALVRRLVFTHKFLDVVAKRDAIPKFCILGILVDLYVTNKGRCNFLEKQRPLLPTRTPSFDDFLCELPSITDAIRATFVIMRLCNDE